MRWMRSRWLRLLGGLVILVVVVRVWGVRPFAEAAQGVDVRLLALATAVAAVTTTCAAWRWALVAGGLGGRLPLLTAVAGCYRSQVLNSTLPGGVLGDVHRGVHHGPLVGGVGLGLRTVWWERTAGQVVQVAVTVAVLLAVPSPLRPSGGVVLSALGVLAALAVVLLALGSASRAWPRAGGVVRVVQADVRLGLLGRAWPGVLLASLLVVAGHWVTFLLAARAAGSTAPTTTLLPVGLLVLVASGLPVNVAGWGPREGAAAAVFGAAGLGASAGVTAAALYGVLALVATVPGLVVLGLDAWRGSSSGRPAPPRAWTAGEPAPVRVRTGSGSRG
jgi:hypothetical protein